MDPNDPFWRALRQQQEHIRQTEQVRRAMYPSESTLAMLRGINQMQQTYRNTYNALRGPADLVRELDQQLKNAQALGFPRYDRELRDWRTLRESIGGHALEGITKSLLATSSLQMQAHLSQIASQLQRTSWLTQVPSVRDALYAPALDYSAFARRSLDSASHASPAQAKAIEASVLLADVQLAEGTDLVMSVLQSPGEHQDDDRAAESGDGKPPTQHDEGDNASPAAALFAVQQEELLALPTIEPGVEYFELLAGSPSAEQVNLAHQLGMLIGELNQARMLVNAAEIFPPTTAMLMAMNTLLYSSVQSKDALGNAVDALYILVYEGSGSGQRILEWLDASSCEALWTLKQLRNVWLRHDPEHGSATDQSKKWAKLREGLAFLGFAALPGESAAHARLYAQLLRELNAMLTSLRLKVLSHT